MTRSGTKTTPPDRGKPPAADALLDLDLAGWAGVRIAAAGRKDALLGRVELLRLEPDGQSLEARVRGNRPLPYRVRVWVGDGAVHCRCTCAAEGAPACTHAVAAVEVLRFPAAAVPRDPAQSKVRKPRGKVQLGGATPEVAGYLLVGADTTLTREERLALAGEEERNARRQRMRREKATVTLLEEATGPPRFHVGAGSRASPYQVVLRGTMSERASCTCEDFARNELGTCKHIERVRQWYLRKKKRIPERLLSVWWSPKAWEERVPDPLQEIRVDTAAGEIPDALKEYFDEDGWLRVEAQRDWVDAERVELAVEAARTTAKKLGWAWDLDATVQQHLDDALLDQRLRQRSKTIDRESAAWREIIPGLGLKLHPYQEEGVQFLVRTRNAFLADDMGLGKTVQAIAASLLLRREVGAEKVLVVCPASLKHQWRREIEKVCGEQSTVLEGPRSRRLAAYRDWSQGFLILNYELVVKDLAEIRQASIDIVILDEAQRIKNWETKTAQAVKQLESRHAFVLTGTPLENRLLELHSLVEFISPRALGPRWRLLPFHAVTDAQGRILAYEGLQALRRRLQGFFLRRDRETVLDQLPERTENTYWTGMTLAQRRPYRKLASTVASLVSSKRQLSSGETRILLQSLTSMRILCNAHAQYAWNDFEERVRAPEPPTRTELRALNSPKLEEFARVLEELLEPPGTKVVVFSQWERMLRLAMFTVRELLDRGDLRAGLFHGGLTSRARGSLLDAFRVDPDFRVLFSTDAGGLGLNLQEAASIVVNLEVPWNPAILEQRIGRVHRIGQRRSVQVLHFVTGGAIEERVRQVVEGKRALFDGLLVDGLDEVVFDDASRATLVERMMGMIDEPRDPDAPESIPES